MQSRALDSRCHGPNRWHLVVPVTLVLLDWPCNAPAIIELIDVPHPFYRHTRWVSCAVFIRPILRSPFMVVLVNWLINSGCRYNYG